MASTPHAEEGTDLREERGVVLVLFDGDCALCQRSVVFLLEHDRLGRMRFSPLDSAAGRRVGGDPGSVRGAGSILVLDGSELLRESEAVLRLAGHLRFPWNLLRAARLVPRGLRDGVYRWIARNRLRWFGTSDGCSLMRPEWKDRFVEEQESPIFPP